MALFFCCDHGTADVVGIASAATVGTGPGGFTVWITEQKWAELSSQSHDYHGLHLDFIHQRKRKVSCNHYHLGISCCEKMLILFCNLR